MLSYDEIILYDDSRKLKKLYNKLLLNGKIHPDSYRNVARNLHKNFEQVIIISGFPKGDTYENDGLIGAFVLGDMFKNLLEIPKVMISLPENLLKRIKNFVEIQFPKLNFDSSKQIIKTTNFEYHTLGVSIECPGPNIMGIAHHMNGNAISFFDAQILKIWSAIKTNKSQSYTIGIGDGGNELGLGNFEHEIREIIPFGDICNCPCKHGIATNVKADDVLLATTSNWAAFLLSSLCDYNFNYKKEKEWLISLNKCGIIDGISGKLTPTVDNIPPDVEKQIITKIFPK